jgi:NAD(P)-dependent dehydrogenase (short-subunit alcohol dehydrogenase family)
MEAGMKQFEGKSVIVTGAGRGIGRQLALDFSGRGARVAVNYSASADGAAAVVDEIAAAGGEAIPVRADVTDRAAVEAMVAAVLDAFGGVDILVNNAGINIDKPFLELAEADWDRVMDVNLKGPFLCSQAAGRAMVAAGRGCIVNISAVTAVDARRNAANYCSAKAGLNMLTKCTALELAPHVNVNALALGYVESPIVRALYTDEQLEAIVGVTPLARMSNFEEVSEFVIFMASREAAFMTGQTIVFDGGRVMR